MCVFLMAISYQWCFLFVGMVPWIMGHVCRSFGKQSWQLDRRPIDGDQTKPPRNAPWIQKVSFFSTFMSILGEECSTMWMFSATVSSVISYFFQVFCFFTEVNWLAIGMLFGTNCPSGQNMMCIHQLSTGALVARDSNHLMVVVMSCPVDVLAIPSEEEK